MVTKSFMNNFYENWHEQMEQMKQELAFLDAKIANQKAEKTISEQRLVRCSSCGGTAQPLRRDSRNAVACNDCFRRWRFLGPDAKKERDEWKVIEAPNKEVNIER